MSQGGNQRARRGLSALDGQQGSRDGFDSPGTLLTADEVAELLGVPRSWVYSQSRAGLIPTVTLGRYRRYRREAIESWLAEIETHGRGANQGGP